MKNILIVVTAIGMLTLVAGVMRAQSGTELFSQALSKERTDGKMAEAIKLYQTIVERFPNDHNLVANALLRMGLSYEKLGNSAEARKAFDQIISDYKDQVALATEARKLLDERGTARFAGQGGVIWGSVTERGQPVADAQVYAMKAIYEDGQRRMKPVLSAKTNLRGEYDLTGLGQGTYYVVSVIRDFAAGLGPVDNPRMHVPIYFPGTPDWKKAALAEIQPGDAIVNMPIDAAAVPVWRVRGTATNATPAVNGKGQTTVTMMERNLPMPLVNLLPILTVAVDPNGTFEILRVPSGSYVLYASQPGGNGGHVDIEVRDRDLDGVAIPMTPGLIVSGRIVPPLSGVRVTLRLDPPVNGATAYGEMSASNGTFKIALGDNSRPLQAGDYRVSAAGLLIAPIPPLDRLTTTPQPSSTSYAESIRLGEADVLNNGLHLRGQPDQELVIVVGNNPGTLEGRVVNARGEPVPLSTVVLIPQGGIRFRVEHKFIAPDASGRFLLERIPPGDYKLFAWQHVDNREWQDPDFVRPYESRGRLIHIKEGEKQVNGDLVVLPPKP